MKPNPSKIPHFIARARFRIAFGVVVAATLAIIGMRYPAATARTTEGAPPLAPVSSATFADLTETLDLSVEFRPFQAVNVYARVTGYVRQMKVDVGDRVTAGTTLAVLEIPELQDDVRRATAGVERARQEAARASAAFDEAHLRFTRLTEVVARQPNLVAQQDIDEARARDEAAKAARDAAQSAVREAQAGHARFATMVSYSKITAPFTGVIAQRYADTGSLVGAGTGASTQALVRLLQLDPLRLVLPVPESAVGKVRVGMPVEVHVQSTGGTVHGTVARTSGDVSTSTRTMHVEVDVPNPDLQLAPGMYATATLAKERRDHVLAIPIEAAPDRKAGSANLLVVGKDRRIVERHVTLGLETATQIEVRDGLQAGELVVVGSRGQLRAGQLVTPKPVGTASSK